MLQEQVMELKRKYDLSQIQSKARRNLIMMICSCKLVSQTLVLEEKEIQVQMLVPSMSEKAMKVLLLQMLIYCASLID